MSAAALSGCRHGNPDALWQIVHQGCVPNQEQHSNPAPCVSVDLRDGEAHGSAVLKDRNGPYQYLLIPSARITGIESAPLYADGAVNYFAAAWAARHFVEQGVGHPLPRELLSLAINSRYARSQNQLHIHIDCLKSDVREALRRQLPNIGDDWAPLATPLAGHRFGARRVHDTDLVQNNPLRLLPVSLRESESERTRLTLVLAGAHFADGDDGFVLLAGHAALWPFDPGHGEDLQDHACR